MRLPPILGIFLAAALAVFTFQNCARTNFAQDGSENSFGDGGGESVEVIGQNCSTSQVKRLNKHINFAKPANISGTNSACDWGKNGNLTEKNGWIQSRSEQYEDLGVPANATICSMKFTFENQNMLYDDEIMLTYKNAVLATSYKDLLRMMPSKNNINVYDWNSLKGKESDISGYDPYCAGQSEGKASCSMPRTQESGTIKIIIDDVIFHRISSQYPNAAHRFGFITTGDNDRTSDCKHEPIGFDVQVTYY